MKDESGQRHGEDQFAHLFRLIHLDKMPGTGQQEQQFSRFLVTTNLSFPSVICRFVGNLTGVYSITTLKLTPAFP
jgi:hypothetical protein